MLSLITDHRSLITLLPFRDPVSSLTHLVWAALAIPATVYLWQAARPDRPKQISLLIFGLGTITCFGCSGVYHAVRVPWEELHFYITLDYIGIYLLIAASCTGMAFSLLHGRWRFGLLLGAWLAAAAGIIARLT